MERQKREKYNPDEIFKNKQQNINVQKNLNENYNSKLLIEVQKQNIFQKLLGFIKKLLKQKF